MDDKAMNICCKGYKSPDSLESEEKNGGLRMDLEETLHQMEKRHDDLAHRRQYLTQKILTLEKTLPLIAFKNWSCGQKNKAPFLGKIKEILDQLSPYPHPTPTEKLLEETKKKLRNLDDETDALHKQIIETEIKLEESEMELESLELVNNELNEKLKIIKNEATARERKGRAFPDLDSIDPEDLVCLGKLRQLVQQEIRLKNCINALEERERRIRSQLEVFLAAKQESCPKPQRSNGKKSQKQKDKYKNQRSSEEPSKVRKRFPCSGSRSRKACHCGSDESLNFDSLSSDESTSDEYCDCCDCGISSAAVASSDE